MDFTKGDISHLMTDLKTYQIAHITLFMLLMAGVYGLFSRYIHLKSLNGLIYSYLYGLF